MRILHERESDQSTDKLKLRRIGDDTIDREAHECRRSESGFGQQTHVDLIDARCSLWSGVFNR